MGLDGTVAGALHLPPVSPVCAYITPCPMSLLQPVDLHMLDENKGTEDHGQSREAVTPCLSHLFRWLSTAPALGAQHGGTRHGSSIVWSLDATAHCPAS
ncbi:hypothetical protein TRIUR3_14218 [Triticum urartu]|uniref:Uncharacterized protein n=1 Tax=Triticum urartu TaxID=4572 RepID=M7ZS23_TRIUA|nr:hypothetical protein TRIUR3_14218 [Triticum urartu]